MKCPNCGGRLYVVNSLPYEDQIYRQRKCKSCGYMPWSIEYIVEENEALKEESNEAWKLKKGTNKK